MLDPVLFELRRDGRRVPMEPQAFDVLAYLVSHRDRVVSKEELMDAVWGGRFVSETAVTSRIKQVRRALGDDGQAQRLIRTVHGRGYRFVAGPAEAYEPGGRAATPAGTVPGALHRQRRAAHRLPGNRWRRSRHRADLRVRLPPRAGLGRPAARPLPRSAGLDGPADPLRQARHRDVGPAARRARPRDPDARRAGRDGRGRLRSARCCSATPRAARWRS